MPKSRALLPQSPGGAQTAHTLPPAALLHPPPSQNPSVPSACPPSATPRCTVGHSGAVLGAKAGLPPLSWVSLGKSSVLSGALFSSIKRG